MVGSRVGCFPSNTNTTRSKRLLNDALGAPHITHLLISSPMNSVRFILHATRTAAKSRHTVWPFAEGSFGRLLLRGAHLH